MKKIYLTIFLLIAVFADSQSLPYFDCNQSTITPAYSYSVPGTYTLQGATSPDEVVFLSCPNTIVYDTLTGLGRHAIVNANCHFITDRGNTPTVFVYFVKSTGTLTLRPNIQQPIIRIYYETGAVIVNQTTFTPTSISCTNISMPNYTCTGVGIAEKDLKDNLFLVYPNPTTDKLFLESNSVTINSVTLADLLGKEIPIKITPDKVQEIDLADFPKGIYFLKVKNENATTTFKIIKN